MLGCNKLPQTGDLKQQKFTFPQFGIMSPVSVSLDPNQ